VLFNKQHGSAKMQVMNLKQKMKEWLKETTNKVIASIITAGILAVIGLIYTNKNVYVAVNSIQKKLRKQLILYK
jgi:ribosome-associated translation inhibitor RaiA